MINIITARAGGNMATEKQIRYIEYLWEKAGHGTLKFGFGSTGKQYGLNGRQRRVGPTELSTGEASTLISKLL